MSNPVIDIAAAEAFTKKYGFTHNRYGDKLAATITFGPESSAQKGKPRCACKVWGSFDHDQCTNVGKVAIADGTTWCGTHAPAAVDKRAAKADERSRKWEDDFNRRMDANKEAQRMAAAFPRLLEALRAIEAGDNDPRATARAALGEYLNGKDNP